MIYPTLFILVLNPDTEGIQSTLFMSLGNLWKYRALCVSLSFQ